MNELEFKKGHTSMIPLKGAEHLLGWGHGVLNMVDTGIVIADATLKGFPIVYVNKAFEQITGYSNEEVLGKNCNFLQSDDRHQQEIEILRQALRSGTKCKVTLRNYRKNGSMFWNELALTPIRNDKGEVTYFMGVQNDVTNEIKQVLIRKAKSEILEMVVKKSSFANISKAIQHILEQQIPKAIVAIMLADRNGKSLSEVNAPKLPAGLTKTILKRVPIRPNFCCCATSAFLKKRVIQKRIHEERIWRKHHDVVTESGLKSCWSYPMVGANDEILGVLSIFHHQTIVPEKSDERLIWELVNLAALAVEQSSIRKQLRENLEELSTYSKKLEKKVEKRTRDLKKAVLDLKASNAELFGQTREAKEAKIKAETNEAIYKAIIKEFPKGAILLVDSQMHILFMDGTELMDVQQQIKNSIKPKVNELKGFSNQRKQIFATHIQKTLQGEHLSFETEYQRVTYAINTTPLYTENGNITHALFVLLNITKRKQNEKRMLENLIKERELSDLKSRFITTASHEFRTPLSVILSSTTLIEKQNQPGLEERRLKHLKRIKSNVQHLVTVLNDFLSLSKLEEGKTIAHPEWFDLLAISKVLLDQMELSKKKGQVIDFVHNKDEIRVFMDPKFVRHILFNLIGNAIKYSEERQRILLNIHETKQGVSIEVKDKGMGIPTAEQPYLFQRFFRAKNSLNIAGTGLGLHIVKQYTELMKGTISFKSKENKGSTFKVTFPKRTKENEKSTSN